jgi:hypothetical protein
MQAILAHHTNASIFFGHAVLAYLIFNKIRFRSILVIRKSLRQQAHLTNTANLASITHHLNTPKSSQNPRWTNAINSILQMTEICHYTSFGVYSLNPIPFQYGKYRPLLCISVQVAMFALFSLFVS